ATVFTLRNDVWYFLMAANSASAMRWRYADDFSSFASCAFVTNEISVSTLGIAAPISTTNGACLTPRSFVVLFAARSFSIIERWTAVAKSRDSSSLLLSAMALTKSGSAAIDWPDAAFSRAATEAALRLFAKLRKYVS